MTAAFLKWTQRVLFAGAFLALGYCAFVLTDSWMFQHTENAELDRLLPADDPAPQVTTPDSTRPATPSGGTVGRIEVKRLGLSVVVVEGTDTASLARAAGHIAGTSLPGEHGNVGIAAHRDTFFRPLRNIRKDDVISVTTPTGDYRYRVVSTEVVDPGDVAVLNSDGTDVLTLVTCYPFGFIGAAPNRFIVRAERVSTPLQPVAVIAHPRV